MAATKRKHKTYMLNYQGTAVVFTTDETKITGRVIQNLAVSIACHIPDQPLRFHVDMLRELYDNGAFLLMSEVTVDATSQQAIVTFMQHPIDELKQANPRFNLPIRNCLFLNAAVDKVDY